LTFLQCDKSRMASRFRGNDDDFRRFKASFPQRTQGLTGRGSLFFHGVLRASARGTFVKPPGLMR